MKALRRPGVNVGDTVRFKPKQVERYAAVYAGLTDGDAFAVIFRQAAGFNGVGGYVCHLTNSSHDRTVLAKPGHVRVVKRNPDLSDPVAEEREQKKAEAKIAREAARAAVKADRERRRREEREAKRAAKRWREASS